MDKHMRNSARVSPQNVMIVAWIADLALEEAIRLMLFHLRM